MCSFGNNFERPGLVVFELDHFIIASDHLVAVVDARLEQLRQCKPLARHLVAVIGIHELVIVDAVWSIALDALDGGLAAVERDDVVYESLSFQCTGIVSSELAITFGESCVPSRAQGQRFGRIRRVVLARGRLARFEVLSWF